MARTLAIICVLLCFIIRSVFPQDAAADYLAKGDSAYAAFNNEIASAYYQEAYQLNGLSYEASWKLARAHIDLAGTLEGKKPRRKRFSMAAEYARFAIENHPDSAKGHLFLSIALGRIGLEASPRERVKLSSEIKSAIDRALELDPNDSLAWHVLGRWHRRVASISWLERKLANMLLGSIPKESSFEKATECFERAVEFNPDGIDNHLELGLTYEKMDRREKAIAEYERVLKLPITTASDESHHVKAAERLRKLR
jgi:tetratricopeptide (TPR) repeat protein